MTEHTPQPPLTVEQVIAKLQAIANSHAPRPEYWYLHKNAANGKSVITRRIDVEALRRKRDDREGA
jgi:hypothetical protein